MYYWYTAPTNWRLSVSEGAYRKYLFKSLREKSLHKLNTSNIIKSEWIPKLLNKFVTRVQHKRPQFGPNFENANGYRTHLYTVSEYYDVHKRRTLNRCIGVCKKYRRYLQIVVKVYAEDVRLEDTIQRLEGKRHYLESGLATLSHITDNTDRAYISSMTNMVMFLR